ncbi:MAG: metallophosphoesterase [Oscillospiraceae bacterium]|nr:metallophosphoesterase [Oscillospiraceae bacterium]
METVKEKKHIVRNVILIVVAALIVGFVIYKLISGYISTLPKYTYSYGEVSGENMASYPDTSFAVISDTHYYDTDLGTTGAAFEECLASDRKLLKESAQLLELAVDRIIESDVKFVLVSGDLTKDGEKINHEKVAEQLQRIVDAGKKVFVVPGNHDVNNPLAVKYVGDGTEPVDNVSAEDFAQIYNNFGYSDALLRDDNSLSYVAEPQDGLWIVALDTNEYEKNQPNTEEVWAGELTQDQIDWLQDVLKQANDEGKAVILLEHHGIVEHWEGQSKLHPDYLLSDYKYVGKLLTSYGVRLAFTGHYHAQDISLKDNGEQGFIYDAETGSLSTAPCSMRFCTISNNSLTDKTEHLIDSYGASFAADADAFVKKTIYIEAYNTLKGYHVSDDDSDYIADTISEAFMAHYNGNEETSARVEIDKSKLSLWSKFIYSQYSYAIDGLWVDLKPADGNVTFSLGGVA